MGKGGTENKRRVKKLKYNIISEEWGEEGVDESKTQFLYSGLEGVGPKVRGGGKKKDKEEIGRIEDLSEQEKNNIMDTCAGEGGVPPL